MQGVWGEVTYQSGKAPKIFFAIIGLVIVAMFLTALAKRVGPYLYEKYQAHHIYQCEAQHAVEENAWQPIFGFDMGGRYLVGDSPEHRALIECIVDSLAVETTIVPHGDTTLAEHPSLSVTEFSFHNGFLLENYLGEAATF